MGQSNETVKSGIMNYDERIAPDKRLEIHHHHWQNSPNLAIVFLRSFFHIYLGLNHPVYTSLDFTTVACLQRKLVSLAPNPNLEDQVALCPAVTE
jgi:hypothetical protein